jgi:hypothetical protein
MRNSWAYKTAAPIAAAALMIACSREVKEQSSPEHPRADSGGRKMETIALKGCVQGGTGTNEYVLQHVQLEPIAAQPSDAPTSVGASITEGSAVRLRMTDSDQLKSHLGQIVSVSGTIIDDGRNTIGTGGNDRGPSQQESPVDASRASTDEHHAKKQAAEAGPIGQHGQANGMAPQMAVEKVTASGQQCKG